MKPSQILLLSDKSSGSTIFQYELLKHPEISGAKYTSHNDHETLFWVKAAVLLGRPKSEFFNSEYPFHKGYARKSIIDIVTKNVDGFEVPEDDEKLIQSGWEALTQAHQPIFFEKSPHHLNHWASTRLIIDYVNKNPNVKVIGLTRNPLSVIYSTMSRWFVNPIERQYKWDYTYQNLIKAQQLIPKEQFHLVNYEDLIQKGQIVYKDLCEYLKIDYHSEMGKGVHQKSKEKWKHDESFEIPLDNGVKMTAAYFGYEFPNASRSNLQPKFNINKWEQFVFETKSSVKKYIARNF